ELREFPEPSLEDGSVLLQTTFSEVCGTDVHIWHGRLAGVPYPIIPGHVSVGVAAKTGSARAVEEALDLIRDGGRYVIAGHYTDAGSSSINAHQQINRKHLEIRGCWGSEVGHFVRALRILDRHHETIPWRAIGAKTYALTDLNQALSDAEAMRLPKALVQPN
ncbi:MAG TPA: alcohol dehydrogenase catalytic domain-containing protein, partial [Vicinamibacterales bacterium]